MFIYIHDTIKNTAVILFAIEITKLITIKLCKHPGDHQYIIKLTTFMQNIKL